MIREFIPQPIKSAFAIASVAISASLINYDQNESWCDVARKVFYTGLLYMKHIDQLQALPNGPAITVGTSVALIANNYYRDGAPASHSYDLSTKLAEGISRSELSRSIGQYSAIIFSLIKDVCPLKLSDNFEVSVYVISPFILTEVARRFSSENSTSPTNIFAQTCNLFEFGEPSTLLIS